MSITKSYTFNGNIKVGFQDWIKWIGDAKRIFDLLGVNIDKCSVSSEKGNNIKSLKNLETKIEKIYTKGDYIESITFLALPKNFESYAFDYIITLTRNSFANAYITLILNYAYKEIYTNEYDENEVIDILKENIAVKNGEIYEMDIKECPEFYAGKANEPEFFKSLRVVKKL